MVCVFHTNKCVYVFRQCSKTANKELREGVRIAIKRQERSLKVIKEKLHGSEVASKILDIQDPLISNICNNQFLQKINKEFADALNKLYFDFICFISGKVKIYD